MKWGLVFVLTWLHYHLIFINPYSSGFLHGHWVNHISCLEQWRSNPGGYGLNHDQTTAKQNKTQSVFILTHWGWLTHVCASNLRHSWWCHQMETFSALLPISAGNSPVPGEFPTQRPVARGFDIFFDLRLNKRLSKQSWGCWLETPSRPLWRHRNAMVQILFVAKPFSERMLAYRWLDTSKQI